MVLAAGTACIGFLFLAVLIAAAFTIRTLTPRATIKNVTPEIVVVANEEDSLVTAVAAETPPVSELSLESVESEHPVSDPAESPVGRVTENFPDVIVGRGANVVNVETQPIGPATFVAPVRAPQLKSPLKLQRVFAFTLEQWTLPADEEIVHAEIRHWDDEASLFQQGLRLQFANGRLQIDSESGGLGQPTTLFQLDGDRHLVSIASKWQIDQKADWLLVQTESRTYLLALGREPSNGIANNVDCDVFIETEPVGSDETNNSDYERSVDGGLTQIAISTFRAKHIAEGNHQWKTVPPFAQSQLIINDECLPWDEVQRSQDGLSYDFSMTSQGDWNVAVKDPDASFIDVDSESMYSSRAAPHETRYERQRIKIRSTLSIRLTSTLDDRMSGRLSTTYDDEISERSRVLLQSRMRRFNSPRNARGKTSPYDLQDEDIAYLRVTWFHVPMTQVTERDDTIPNMVDMHRVSRQHPIGVIVGVPEVRFADRTGTEQRIKSKQLVFSEIRIQCH
jgi:hypothetical protein